MSRTALAWSRTFVGDRIRSTSVTVANSGRDPLPIAFRNNGICRPGIFVSVPNSALRYFPWVRGPVAWPEKRPSSGSNRPGHSSVTHRSVTLSARGSIRRIPTVAACQRVRSSACMKVGWRRVRLNGPRYATRVSWLSNRPSHLAAQPLMVGVRRATSTADSVPGMQESGQIQQLSLAPTIRERTPMVQPDRQVAFEGA